MRIWLIKIGEPLPIDAAGDRPLRMGILAEMLSQAGHEVVWWTSAFDHVRKRFRADSDRCMRIDDRYWIHLLHSIGYPKNISLRRLLDHRGIAKKFRDRASIENTPDVILCSLPTPELCAQATSYGCKYGVPVVLDVRDLCPDLFLDLFPRQVQPIAKIALGPMYRTVRKACSNATAITGTTDEYVEWALDHASRPRTSMDRVFPLGYREKEPTEQQIRDASEFWNRHGLSMEEHGFIVCWFGMIGRHSEIEVVIEAASLLAETDRQIRFVLCGTGPDLKKCCRQAREVANVLMPGWVNEAQIWTLMKMSSVGLAPYASNFNYVRNLPNKPIEYLSAGLPIVSSLRGVLANLLSQYDCGVTYENRRPDRLADAIADFHDRPERLESASRNALALYRERFVAEKVYAEFRSYLERIAETKSMSQAA